MAAYCFEFTQVWNLIKESKPVSLPSEATLSNPVRMVDLAAAAQLGRLKIPVTFKPQCRMPAIKSIVTNVEFDGYTLYKVSFANGKTIYYSLIVGGWRILLPNRLYYKGLYTTNNLHKLLNYVNMCMSQTSLSLL